ncbi:hypothetical protein TrispH2_000878 [Trichoplax sp. H2]|nr:hypothetical protein TrispH2_000878 [Trichoplax sp. H2]|eukprot:RDD47640.1 hypothetical protein TrispH2_000878 [Trichoplax sp. H2]
MATDRTNATLVADPPPRYGSQDPEAPPTNLESREAPPPYLPFPGPPPSYSEVVKKIRRTREESDNYPQFFGKIFKMIIGTFGFTIFLGIFLAIPISLIVIGAIYKDQCPVQPKIPIYLIVLGSFGLLKNLLDLCQQVSKGDTDDSDDSEDSDNSESSKSNNVQSYETLITCFLIAWFIAGNVWIYSIYKPSFNPMDIKYCNQTLYLFAFWITTAGYIIVGFFCFCFCCVACVAVCASDN